MLLRLALIVPAVSQIAGEIVTPDQACVDHDVASCGYSVGSARTDPILDGCRQTGSYRRSGPG